MTDQTGYPFKSDELSFAADSPTFPAERMGHLTFDALDSAPYVRIARAKLAESAVFRRPLTDTALQSAASSDLAHDRYRWHHANLPRCRVDESMESANARRLGRIANKGLTRPLQRFFSCV